MIVESSTATLKTFLVGAVVRVSVFMVYNGRRTLVATRRLAARNRASTSVPILFICATCTSPESKRFSQEWELLDSESELRIPRQCVYVPPGRDLPSYRADIKSAAYSSLTTVRCCRQKFGRAEGMALSGFGKWIFRFKLHCGRCAALPADIVVSLLCCELWVNGDDVATRFARMVGVQNPPHQPSPLSASRDWTNPQPEFGDLIIGICE